MKQFVVGWDGGGTKTSMQIRDLDGNVLVNTQAGPLNYNSQSKEELCKTIDSLMEIMHSLPEGISECKSFCISTAGVSNKDAVEFIKQRIYSCGINCDIMIVGDHESALYGALGKPDGMVLVSGTGSICYGKNMVGSTYRTGGYGHLIDDEGSGYAIGRDILAAAVRTYDKRISSVLMELVLSKIDGYSVEDIVSYTYQSNWSKKYIASIAPLLLDALNMGDEQAILICNKATDELIKLVIPVARELKLEEGKIALLGSVLLHYDKVREQFLEKLSKQLPKLQVITPQNDSVTGATLIALERFKQRRGY